MFDLTEEWVWDFWTVDDTAGDSAAHHLFFLHAPRSLGDPELRHRHASVGHAVSVDLVRWTRVADALAPQPAPAYDDLATWTGCVVRDDDGTWVMLTSGLSAGEDGAVQRMGLSTSRDLTTWTRVPDLVLEADDRWYSRRGGDVLEEHWRDPWVLRDDAGRWHMYVTAKAGRGGPGQGVVGHATSHDLRSWSVRAPLSAMTGRFDQLEVISLVRVDGRWVLVFSCLAPEMPGVGPGGGGIWSVAVAGPGTPVDVDRAVRLTNERLYVGKVLPGPDGSASLLAFVNRDASGAFVGGVIDPLPVVWDEAGVALRLDLANCPSAHVYAPASPG